MVHLGYVLHCMAEVKELELNLEKGGKVDSQVGPHDDEEVSPFWHLGLEELGVVDGLLRRVDGAGTDDDQNPIIVSRQNPGGIVASRGDCLLGGRGRNDLVAEEGGLDEGVVLKSNRVRNGKSEGIGCNRHTPTTRRS